MKPPITKVFLADDDRDDVDFFQYVLESVRPGCNLTVFSNGQELVDALHATTEIPDFIFLDINMPFMNGLEALRIIKGISAMASVPVIVYSTSGIEDDVSRAIKYGAVSYVVKPSNLKDLEKIIERILATDWETAESLLEREFVVRG
ncbi:response regulator [Flavobacterium hauense]